MKSSCESFFNAPPTARTGEPPHASGTHGRGIQGWHGFIAGEYEAVSAIPGEECVVERAVRTAERCGIMWCIPTRRRCVQMP